MFLTILSVIGRGVFTVFLKYWKVLVPVILVAIALLYVNHLRTQHIKDQAQIETDTHVITDWSNKFTQLKTDADEAELACKKIIADQNQHVDDLAKQAEKYKLAAASAAKSNASIKIEYEQRIKDLLSQPKPKDDHSSIQYLIDRAKELGTWEEPKHE